MATHNGISLKNMTYNGQKVKKWNHNGVRVFTAGSTVTYYINSSTSYTEEVDSEATCLSPTTFTPYISGWTFVGWREDKTASSSVLTSKVMGDSPITLYAVFRKTITVTYYNNSTTKATTTGIRYYNNGNYANPTFKLTQTTKSGWNARGWSTGTTGNASVTYKNATNFTVTADTTLYGLYQQTVTCTFISNGTQTATGTRYYNSNGNIVNASVTTPTGGTYNGWTWRGWAAAGVTTGNASVAYANGATITGLTTGATFYGLHQSTITVTYYNNSTTASTATGTRYYNAADNFVNPTFKLTQATKSGWNAVGWATGTAANAGIAYSNATSFTRDSNVTLYGRYNQDITCTFLSNGTQYATGTRCYSSNGNVLNASVTVPTGAGLDGWTWRGWSLSGVTDANAGVGYANGATISNLEWGQTFYGLYQRTISVYYNGNGATGGSVATQTGTSYLNAAGNQMNPSFTLPLGGFTKTDYSFAGWDAGFVGGDRYPGGHTLTIGDTVSFYAAWTIVSSKTVYTATVRPSTGNDGFNIFSEMTPTYHDTSHVAAFTNPLTVWSDADAPADDEGEASATRSMTLTINLGVFSRAVVRYYLGESNNYENDRVAHVTVGGVGTYTSGHVGDGMLAWSLNEQSVTISNSLTVSVSAITDAVEDSNVGAGFAISSIVLYP